MKRAAGLLLYRRSGPQLEVLLVHPSGNYNRHKPWSIPKGLPDDGESLVEAAIRETAEEAGVQGIAVESLTPLGSIDYTRSRKRVFGFAAELPVGASPHPACWEIDQAKLFPIEEARQCIHPDQRALIDRLVEHILSSDEPRDLPPAE